MGFAVLLNALWKQSAKVLFVKRFIVIPVALTASCTLRHSEEFDRVWIPCVYREPETAPLIWPQSAAAHDSIFHLRDLCLTLLERKRWNGVFNHPCMGRLNICVVHRNNLKILFSDSFFKSYYQGINFIGWKFSVQVFGRVWKSVNFYSLCCKRVQSDVRNDLKPVYYERGLEPKWSTNFAAVEEDDFVCVAILH